MDLLVFEDSYEVIIEGLNTAAAVAWAGNWRHLTLVIGLLVLQVVITAFEAAAGLPVFVDFSKHISSSLENSTITRSDPLYEYYMAWLIGYSITWVVAVSQLILAITFVAQFCQHKPQPYLNVIIPGWVRLNFVVEYIFDDTLVSFAKILLTLESERDLLELQTAAGQISSMATFVATIIRCLIVSAILVVHSLRAEKSGTQWRFDGVSLLAGLVALSPATLSMLISWSLYDIDPIYRVRNLTLVIVFIFLGYLVWFLVLGLIIYIAYKCCWERNPELADEPLPEVVRASKRIMIVIGTIIAVVLSCLIACLCELICPSDEDDDDTESEEE